MREGERPVSHATVRTSPPANWQRVSAASEARHGAKKTRRAGWLAERSAGMCLLGGQRLARGEETARCAGVCVTVAETRGVKCGHAGAVSCAFGPSSGSDRLTPPAAPRALSTVGSVEHALAAPHLPPPSASAWPPPAAWLHGLGPAGRLRTSLGIFSAGHPQGPSVSSNAGLAGRCWHCT